MDGDRTGWLLVGAQFAATAGLAWPGRRQWRVPRLLAVGAAGLALAGTGIGLAGARRLGPGLRPLPAPPPDAELRRDGVYALVRHPIYMGLLIGAAGAAVLRARREPLIAWALLAVIVQVKIWYEEHLLRARFGSTYERYRRRVGRLLPRPARWPPASRST